MARWKKALQKFADRFRQDDGDDELGYELYGEAVAVGDETLASVDTTSKIAQHGRTEVAKGAITATAAAEGDDPFADAYTDVTVVDADLTIIWTKEETIDTDGVSVDVSTTKFIAIDVPFWEGDATVVIGQDGDYEFGGGVSPFWQRALTKYIDQKIDLDGNVATANVEAEAFGENTLVSVDAHTLAIEGELSEAAVVVTGAVG